MSDLFVDFGYVSLNKQGEQLCGDHIESVFYGEDSAVFVLADGLGSGVKANILSTLTSTIIATMVANEMPVKDCIDTILATLPVCEYRKIAYSTFSMVKIQNHKKVDIIEYDNPQFVLLRDGKNAEYPREILDIENRKIYKTSFEIRKDDILFFFSDGATHAGVGGMLDFGLQREGVIDIIERTYAPEYTSKVLCRMVTDECCRYYDGKPGDDTTVLALKFRERQYVNLMMGPPEHSEQEQEMVQNFLGQPGKHIVCGGSTAALVAHYLGKEIDTSCSFYIDPDIPPIAEIEGLDLVTEGAITMNRVLEYARNCLEENDRYYEWTERKDGAALVARILFEEATDIVFFIGRAVNPAHQSETFSIKFNFKMRIVKDLSKCLEKMGKNIVVKYY